MHHFNVRVYGILIDKGNVLVSDEFIKGKHITKFPGGGLEFGEGTIDCVIREFKEELDLKIEVIRHFYTTDFFVTSAFNTKSQIISIYYLVKALDVFNFKTSEKAFDYIKKEGAQSLRWIPLKEIRESNFTFVIDKKIAELITETKL
jgi:ADP-ribose pyrophosphatase YjhB (NUDIX family)